MDALGKRGREETSVPTPQSNSEKFFGHLLKGEVTLQPDKFDRGRDFDQHQVSGYRIIIDERQDEKKE
jgi:hypothetical protein